jgi:endonuclease YncB( thermonuclease family)
MSFAALALAASTVIAGSHLSGPARVIDGDTIALGKMSVRISGIDAPERDQMCQQGSVAVACGRQATSTLRAIIGAAPVQCSVIDIDRYERPVATSSVGSHDIGAAMVVAGWAIAFTRYSDRYLTEQSTARAARRGLWAMSFQEPAEFRHAKRESRPAPPLPPNPACTIKGNINAKGARIFHQPGEQGYADVRISTADGERWFCSTAEAINAGWRPRRR